MRVNIAQSLKSHRIFCNVIIAREVSSSWSLSSIIFFARFSCKLFIPFSRNSLPRTIQIRTCSQFSTSRVARHFAGVNYEWNVTGPGCFSSRYIFRSLGCFVSARVNAAALTLRRRLGFLSLDSRLKCRARQWLRITLRHVYIYSSKSSTKKYPFWNLDIPTKILEKSMIIHRIIIHIILKWWDVDIFKSPIKYFLR